MVDEQVEQATGGEGTLVIGPGGQGRGNEEWPEVPGSLECEAE